MLLELRSHFCLTRPAKFSMRNNPASVAVVTGQVKTGNVW